MCSICCIHWVWQGATWCEFRFSSTCIPSSEFHSPSGQWASVKWRFYWAWVQVGTRLIDRFCLYWSLIILSWLPLWTYDRQHNKKYTLTVSYTCLYKLLISLFPAWPTMVESLAVDALFDTSLFNAYNGGQFSRLRKVFFSAYTPIVDTIAFLNGMLIVLGYLFNIRR